MNWSLMDKIVAPVTIVLLLIVSFLTLTNVGLWSILFWTFISLGLTGTFYMILYIIDNDYE